MRVVMANKFDLQYQASWPEHLPEEERVIFLCKRLSHESRKRVQDLLLSATTESSDKVTNLEFSVRIGTVAEYKLRESIYGWDQLIDEGGKPIAFTWSKLTCLLNTNFDQPTDVAGGCEAFLLNQIDRANNLEDNTRKNLQRSATGSTPVERKDATEQ